MGHPTLSSHFLLLINAYASGRFAKAAAKASTSDKVRGTFTLMLSDA
jgi:hypothetical protein